MLDAVLNALQVGNLSCSTDEQGRIICQLVPPPPTIMDQISGLINIAWPVFFIVLIFFGQRIQARIALFEIDRTVRRLEFLRNEVKVLALRTIRDVGKPSEDPTPYFNTLLEHFLITPVDMDPSGIISKFDHLIDVNDFKFKSEVKKMAPNAGEYQLNNLDSLVQASLALNTIFRVVRHFYLLGKKTSSYFIIVQLQMLLPLIMQEAEAFMGAAKAFAEGQPIGDGIGALAASKLMVGSPQRKLEKDMVASESNFEGRRLIVLKAEGPGGNVGKPGDAMKQIIEENSGKVSMIIMVDAALKFEGENTGEISEGIGAAIGGIGTERFKIEEIATKYKVPVHALIVKESIQEAIMPMKKEISEATEKVLERVKKIILERSSSGETIILAGIGNTIGIGQ